MYHIIRASKIRNYNEEWILGRLRYLGRLYDFDGDGREIYEHFQDLLDKYDSNKTTGLWNIYERMKWLSPDCEDLLINCQWQGNEVNCLDIFVRRRTQEGFCCTFNYVRTNLITDM